MFKFEKLDVWQEAVTFSDETYRCTGIFPEAERYGLVNQLRRSAVSIAANIAEGSGRTSSTDFARFVEIAYGSLMESVSHLAIARRHGFLSEDIYEVLYAHAEKLGRMLSGLRNTLKGKSPRES